MAKHGEKALINGHARIINKLFTIKFIKSYIKQIVNFFVKRDEIEREVRDFWANLTWFLPIFASKAGGNAVSRARKTAYIYARGIDKSKKIC